MKQIEFKAPQGYTPPEGVKPGETFHDLATFKLKDNGNLCLLEIGDTSLGEYKDDAKEGVPQSAARQMEQLPNYQTHA